MISYIKAMGRWGWLRHVIAERQGTCSLRVFVIVAATAICTFRGAACSVTLIPGS